MPDQLRHQPDTYRIHGVHVRRFPPRGNRHETGKPVIAVHGGNHQGEALNLYAKVLSDSGFDVHVLDWYNHGNSDQLPVDRFVQRGIEDVALSEIESVASVVNGDPILIGHSMGGLASLIYAAERWVDKLVLIAPSPPVFIGAPIIPAKVDWDTPFDPPPFEAAKQMFWQDLTDEEAQPLYELLGRESPRAVWEATRHTLYVNLGAVRRPVLCIAPELDTLYPPEHTRKLAELLGADYREVAGAGHSDILSHPPAAQVAQSIADWLNSEWF